MKDLIAAVLAPSTKSGLIRLLRIICLYEEPLVGIMRYMRQKDYAKQEKLVEILRSSRKDDGGVDCGVLDQEKTPDC